LALRQKGDEPKAQKWHGELLSTTNTRTQKTIYVGGGEMKGIWMHNTPNGLAMKCIKIRNKSCTAGSSDIRKMIEHL